MAGLRVGTAVILLLIALYWGTAAVYEFIAARKPPGVLGVSLIGLRRPAPVLSVVQWRQGGLFLLAMAAVLALVGIRLIQGW